MNHLGAPRPRQVPERDATERTVILEQPPHPQLTRELNRLTRPGCRTA